jgi:hypothetical protein
MKLAGRNLNVGYGTEQDPLQWDAFAAHRNATPRVRDTTVSVDPASFKPGVPSAKATMSKRTLATMTPRKYRSIELNRISLRSFHALA